MGGDVVGSQVGVLMHRCVLTHSKRTPENTQGSKNWTPSSFSPQRGWCFCVHTRRQAAASGGISHRELTGCLTPSLRPKRLIVRFGCVWWTPKKHVLHSLFATRGTRAMRNQGRPPATCLLASPLRSLVNLFREHPRACSSANATNQPSAQHPNRIASLRPGKTARNAKRTNPHPTQEA